ncbi:MAG: hypothetical protein RL367_1182 [Pseudomonadota bacterium]
MKSTGLLKIATSSLILGSVLTGCGQGSDHVASASSGQSRQSIKQAAALAKQVRAALVKGQAAQAVLHGERMVMLVPDDASYRQLLGESYLAAGRFTSAEVTLGDALELAPSNEKVALKLVLVKAALGKQQPAQALLQDYRNRIAATDYGLAQALAGDIEGAIPTLETVVRSPSADARARQNLALVYAMANRWLEARTVAAQDLSPDLLNQRITQWASFVRPKGSWDQVASLLGVTPAYDAGQPSALAMAHPANQQDALAEIAPPAPVDEQAAIAAAEPVPVYRPVEQASANAAPVFEMGAKNQAGAVPTVASPRQPIKTAIAKSRLALPRRAAPHPSAKHPVAIAVAASKTDSGKFAVQLGAFDNASKASAAWTQAVGKVAALKDRKPTRTAIKVNATNFVRLAIAGLNTRAQADQLCASIRAGGGDCFVRGATNAMLPVQFAAKVAPKLAAKAVAAKPLVRLSSTQPVPKPMVKQAVAKPAVRLTHAQPTTKPIIKVAASLGPKPAKIAAR